MNLTDIVNRVKTPEPWSEGDNIPWNDPEFSKRMLQEHLTQDHELAFTIPMSKVETTIKGLEKGHQSGMHRYPTPSSIKLEGVLPPAYEKLSALLREERPEI